MKMREMFHLLYIIRTGGKTSSRLKCCIRIV